MHTCSTCLHFGILKGRDGVCLGHVFMAPITTEPPPDGVTRAEHPFVYQADVDGTCELWTNDKIHP